MAQASDDGSARSCASISASESAVRPDWANPATWRSVMAAVICRAGFFRILGKNRSRTATASGAPSSFFIVSSTVYVTLLSSLSPEAGGQISQKIRDFVVIIHKSRLIVKSSAAGGDFRRIPPVQIAQELARRGRNMRPAGQRAHLRRKARILRAQRPRVWQKPRAVAREHHARLAALKQRHAPLLLQIRDHAADTRLRIVQPLQALGAVLILGGAAGAECVPMLLQKHQKC